LRYLGKTVESIEGKCEALYVTDRGTFVVQGKVVTDAQAIADNHTVVGPELIEEGLQYAAEHAEEIDAEVAQHTERPLEELLEMFPGMRVITFEVDEVGGQHS